MLYVVTGPPAAGKSTWCQEQAGDEDIIIDYDLLALALSPPRPGKSKHEHSTAAKTVTKAARRAAITKATELARTINVYIIHSTPSPTLLGQYEAKGATIITIDPGLETVLTRAKRERPWWMLQVIKRWYEDQNIKDRGINDPSPPQTTPDSPDPRSFTPGAGNALTW